MSKHLRRTLQCRHSDRLVSLEGPEAYPRRSATSNWARGWFGLARK